MRTLPTGSVDPNFGRRVRNRRQLNSWQNTRPYGYSMPIAVRNTQDAFSRSGWLWPVDRSEERISRNAETEVQLVCRLLPEKKIIILQAGRNTNSNNKMPTILTIYN